MPVLTDNLNFRKAKKYVEYRIDQVSDLVIGDYRGMFTIDNIEIGIMVEVYTDEEDDEDLLSLLSSVYYLLYLYPEYQVSSYYHRVFTRLKEQSEDRNRTFLSIDGSDDIAEWCMRYGLPVYRLQLAKFI